MRCYVLLFGHFFAMEDIKIFESNEFGNVRIVLDEKGAPWFVGTDVAKCLGYLKPTDAVRNAVDEEDVIILSSSCKSSIQFGRSLLNQAVREIRLINESGVYSLILQSKIKSARSFKRWVTKEVLPSIRETGSYSSLIKLPNFTDPAEAAEAWAKEYRGRVAAEKLALEEKAKAEEVAKVLESKKEDIEFSESFIMSGESDLLIRDLAKKLEQNDIIISDKCLRDFLVKIKIIVKRIKVNGDWEITANAVKKGFAHYRDKNICTESGKVVYARTIYITGKGYRYILSSINGSKKSDFILCGGMFRDYGVFAGLESFSHWDN